MQELSCNKTYPELLNLAKKINPEMFEQLDYYYFKGTKIFVDFILKKYPFEGYSENQYEKEHNKNDKSSLYFLLKKYEPEDFKIGNTYSILRYCLHKEICVKLNYLFSHDNIENKIEYNNIKEGFKDKVNIRDKKEIFFYKLNIKNTIIKKNEELTQDEIKELEKYIEFIFHSNNINKRAFIEKSIIASRILKKYIRLEKEKNPNNYIDINKPLTDYENIYKNLSSFDNKEFWFSLFVKSIHENGIEINITKEKDKKIKDIELAFFQALFSLRNYKKYELHFNYGDYYNAKILCKPNNFIEQCKKKLAEKLNIEENKFILTDVREGSVISSLVFLDMTIEEIKKSIIKLKEIREIFKIEEKPIIEVLKLNPEILDKAGNRYKGWGINETRGGESYIPPINDWNGIGLKVRDRYDNGNNAWLGYKNLEGEYSIAYLGIEDNIIEEINSSIKPSESLNSQLYANDINIKQKSENNINVITEENEEKCGDGICVFQNPDFAENSASFIDVPGYQIKFILMCRVNPNNIRQPESFKDCWILDPNEIRIYRILVKKIPISPLTEETNCLKLLLKPDNNFISILKSKDYSLREIANEERFNNIRSCENTQVEKDDLFVIRLYSSFYFKFINAYIREEKVEKTWEKLVKTKDENNNETTEKKIFKGFTESQLKSWICCLQLALSRNINVKENTIVYRGIRVKFPSNIGIGKKFYLKEFLSTSTRKEFAEDGSIIKEQ